MIAQVEVANPGFENALAALAQIGRAIDQAIRRATLPSLGLPRVNPLGSNAGLRQASLPGAGVDPGVADSAETNGGQQALYSVPAPQPPSIVPALPGLESLRALSQSIADALSAMLLPTLDGISRSIAECCAKIGQTIGEACKCAGVPVEMTKAIERIERSIAKASEFGWDDVLRFALPVAGIAATIAAGVAVALAAPELAAVVAAAVAAVTVAKFLKWFTIKKLLEEDSPEDIDKSTDDMLDDARNMDKSPVKGRQRPFRAYPYDQRLDTLRGHIRDFESKLERLREIIEDPEAETDSEKHILREDAERIVPSVKSKFEELQRLYEELTKEPPSLDPELQEWLRGRDEQNDGPPPVGPEYDPEAVPVPGPISSLPPGIAPASVATPGGMPLERLMELVLARLTEPVRLDPVRLEVRVLDDRVTARRLDGNRGVSVDFSRGPRMVGYISV